MPTTEELPKISVYTLPSNSKPRRLQSEDILRELRQEQGNHLLENNPQK